MMMNKRTFTKEELRIIKEASEQGVKVILEKYEYEPEGSSLLTCDNPQWVGEGVSHKVNERRRNTSTTIGSIITFGRSLL